MHNSKPSASKRALPSGKKGAVENPDVVLAARIRKSFEKKDMVKLTTLGLYSLKVKESLFGLPFCALSDEIALDAQKQLLPLSNLYKVGSFCQYDGSVSRLSRPVLVLDNKVEK